MKVRIRKYHWQPTMPDWVYEIEILRNAWWSFFEFTSNWQERYRVSVKIDPWDTWSMDHTLAEIALPMLVQLKQTKHGAPSVDPEDVPENLRPGKLEIEQYEKDGTTDELFFKRWDWVLDEMIYAFHTKVQGDEVYMRFDPATQREEMQAEQERISNGFRLFGKYYEALWD